MRWRHVTITTSIAGLVAVGFAAPSQAQLTTRCVGVETRPITVPNDLVVPAGRSCDLTGVTVQGNVTVRENANLFTDGVSIDGNLVVRSNGFVNAVDTDVAGHLRLNAAFGGYVEDSHVGGVSRSNMAGFLYSLDSHHAGNVVSVDGETFLESSTVAGNVNTTGDLLSDVYDSTLSGNLSVTDAELGTVVCSSEVDGNARVLQSGYVVQIGAEQPLGDCGFNVFGGNLVLRDNTADVHVSNNVVRGIAVATGNDPAPVGQGNRFRGEVRGQFVDMEPEPEPTVGSSADPRSMGTASASPAVEDRKADVLDKVEARAARGERAAKTSGKAALGR